MNVFPQKKQDINMMAMGQENTLLFIGGKGLIPAQIQPFLSPHTHKPFILNACILWYLAVHSI